MKYGKRLKITTYCAYNHSLDVPRLALGLRLFGISGFRFLWVTCKASAHEILTNNVYFYDFGN